MGDSRQGKPYNGVCRVTLGCHRFHFLKLHCCQIVAGFARIQTLTRCENHLNSCEFSYAGPKDQFCLCLLLNFILMPSMNGLPPGQGGG